MRTSQPFRELSGQSLRIPAGKECLSGKRRQFDMCETEMAEHNPGIDQSLGQASVESAERPARRPAANPECYNFVTIRLFLLTA